MNNNNKIYDKFPLFDWSTSQSTNQKQVSLLLFSKYLYIFIGKHWNDDKRLTTCFFFKYFPLNILMTHTRMTRTHINDLKFIQNTWKLKCSEMYEKEMDLSYYLKERDKNKKMMKKKKRKNSHVCNQLIHSSQYMNCFIFLSKEKNCETVWRF